MKKSDKHLGIHRVKDVNPIQILLMVSSAPLNTSEKWMEPVKMKAG